MCIATSIIVVNIPQPTTPDPRSKLGFGGDPILLLPNLDQGSVVVLMIVAEFYTTLIPDPITMFAT